VLERRNIPVHEARSFELITTLVAEVEWIAWRCDALRPELALECSLATRQRRVADDVGPVRTATD
jgi:hypothetical protein